MQKNRDTILVSGAGGFIGCHLIRALLRDGRKVVALARNGKKFTKAFGVSQIENLTIAEADLTNVSALKKVAERIKGRCILVHLGGYILSGSGQTSEYDANISIDINIKGSCNLIKIFKSKLNYACLVSTLDVYGAPKYLPLDEEHPVFPNTFYAASKLAMEWYAAIELHDEIPFSILRLSHVYGPGDPHPKVLQLFINAIRSGKNPVIYGDGLDLRDYVHVYDVDRVIIESIFNKACGTFNVATGKSYTLNEIAEIAIKISGKKMKPVFRKRQNPRTDYSFNVTKLKNTIDFSPQISIDQGIKELFDGA